MRLIRGMTLKEAIVNFHERDEAARRNSRSLELQKLMGHFVSVCHAVHFAHCRGILHRDIKPSNIMLGRYGETLVVDWGLAKTIGRSPEHHVEGEMTLRPVLSSSGVTRSGSVVGTPAYMSPEQADGRHDDLQPTCDVYSLGATLYCLLTGGPPFSIEDLNLTDLGSDSFSSPWRRGIKPEPPREKDPTISKSLQAVCLKAMACEPEDRYDSALAIAEDIERWRADEPVSAMHETWQARLSRWMRRHTAWIQVGTAATLLITLVSIFATIVVNRAWNGEKKSKHLALRNLRSAQDAVNTWLTGGADDIAHWPGAQEFRRHLLQEAAVFYDNLAMEETDDPALELERARTLLRWGELLTELGESEDATEKYNRAILILKSLIRTNEADLEVQLALVSAQTKLGASKTSADNLDEASMIFDEVESRITQLVKTHPTNPAYHEALGLLQYNQGLVSQQHGDTGAENLLRQAIRTFESSLHHSEAPQSTSVRFLSVARGTLGAILVDSGKLEDAENLYRAAVANLQNLIDQHGSLPAFASDYSECPNPARRVARYQRRLPECA